MHHESLLNRKREFAAAILAAGLVVYLLRKILLPFVIGFGLAYISYPAVRWLEKLFRLPRTVTVFLFYSLVATPFIILYLNYGSVLLSTGAEWLGNAPALITKIAEETLGGSRLRLFGHEFSAGIVAKQLIALLESFVKTPAGIQKLAESSARFFITVILSIVAMFYFLIEGNSLINGVVRLAPQERRARTRKLFARVDSVLGRFLRGIAAVVVLTAILSWLVFRFYFHLACPLLLASAVGVLELIPMIGPVTSGILTVLAGAGHGGISLVFKLILFYTLLRLAIDQVLAPIILGRAVILPPVIVLFAFLAGGMLFGLLGLLIAVPVAAVFRIILEEIDPPVNEE